MQSNNIGIEISDLIKETVGILKECGLEKMSDQVSQIQRDLTRERFLVSVVGEFNHGKSTFLNHLLNSAPKLPVGKLPTTALLTHIRYSEIPKIAVFDERGTRKAMLDIREESWDGLIANNFEAEQPKGSVIVGIPDAWLDQYNAEFIDCPGANDLSDERARVIGEVLNRSVGAIITLNATCPLMDTEKLFIKNRILSRNTPFTLIIVTKLDLVRKKERNGVIKYIKDLLALNGMNIPMYIPYDIEMPDATYESMVGLAKVKTAIEEWFKDTDRNRLIEEWAKTRVAEIVNVAQETLLEQEKLLKLDDKKRLELINSKKQALNKLEYEWNELSLKMQARANDCYNQFLKKVNDYSVDIVERLQYEASHAGNPEKWWNEDYPYRLKVELANLSVGLENIMSKIIFNDAKWFNTVLNQKFRSAIHVDEKNITDKDEYRAHKSEHTLEFENLSKKQNYAKIGTVALSLALAPVFGIFATMGVGTVGALITVSLFKKKVEEQRAIIKDAIAKDVPAVIIQASENSESRIKELYREMIEDSDKKKIVWLETQSLAIENTHPSKVEKQIENIEACKARLSEIINKTK